VEGAILGDYEPDRYKTGDDKKTVESFTVLAEGGMPDLEAAADAGRIVGEAQNFTRELVNEPANVMTPMRMVEAARKMAAECQLECEVLEREQM
jgi:leucyl aminopeptidase